MTNSCIIQLNWMYGFVHKLPTLAYWTVQQNMIHSQTKLAAIAIDKIRVKMNKQIRKNPSQSNKTYLICL